MSLTILILSAVLVSAECQNWTDTRVVGIDQGSVRGFKYSGDEFYSFYNIPYATVTRRFQIAGPAPTWNETFDAVNRKIVCPQPEVFFIDVSDKTMQEDCLVMNIFVPDTNKTNLPVMVDIHGGAYHAGMGDAHRYTQFAVLHNVIAVTFNHRVGFFGFLCMGTKNIPGNAGLKDIIVALQWVQRNIASFGGNPNEVTLTGCSAGGSLMDLILISKAAEGLFSKAMPDSGSNLGAFSVTLDPIENAKERAKMMNFTDLDNFEALEEFFLNVSVETVISVLPTERPNTLLDYAPCVERDVGQEMIVLHDAPYNILKSGNYTKYPTLYGLTDIEGAHKLYNFEEWSIGMNANFSNFLPGDLKFDNVTQREEVALLIRRFYFNNSPVNLNTILGFMEYYSDILFAYSILRNVKMQVEAGHDHIYLYEFSYYELNTMFQGAVHCSQTAAIRDEDDATLLDEYRKIKSLLREIRYNFMTTGSPVVNGSPVPLWPKLNNTDRSPHLSVGREIELRGALQLHRSFFWDSIYEQYYRIPIPPTIPDSSTDSASLVAINYILTISLSLIIYFM